MATGSLTLHVTDTLHEPVTGSLEMRFDPASGSPGGDDAIVTFTLKGETEFEVDKLKARGGPGTRYEVRVANDHFKIYAFFQPIVEKTTTSATDDPIRLVAKPSAIADIEAPAFADLPAAFRTFMSGAQMMIGPKTHEKEDKELLNLSGAGLYNALGPLRKACLLNLLAKARHISSAKCWSLFRFPMVIRQDRCFCAVEPQTVETLSADEHFKAAPSQLHDPLAGYEIVHSVKSKDTHANIQVTVMRHAQTGEFAADVDIDEASGIQHGFEVIRNKFNGRTNPYLVRELLLLARFEKGALDPGYRFVFKA